MNKTLTQAQSAIYKVNGLPLPYILLSERPLLSPQASFKFGVVSGGGDSPAFYSAVLGVSLNVVVIFSCPNGDLYQVSCSAFQGTPLTSASQKFAAIQNSSFGGFTVQDINLLNTYLGPVLWERLKLHLGLLY
jgi:hypothetical protein